MDTTSLHGHESILLEEAIGLMMLERGRVSHVSVDFDMTLLDRSSGDDATPRSYQFSRVTR